MLHLLGERWSNAYAKGYSAIFPQILPPSSKIVGIVVLILGNSPAEFLRTRNNAPESRSPSGSSLSMPLLAQRKGFRNCRTTKSGGASPGSYAG